MVHYIVIFWLMPLKYIMIMVVAYACPNAGLVLKFGHVELYVASVVFPKLFLYFI